MEARPGMAAAAQGATPSPEKAAGPLPGRVSAPPPPVTPTDRTCPSGMTGPVGARGRPVSRRRLICVRWWSGSGTSATPPARAPRRPRPARPSGGVVPYLVPMPGGAVSVTASEARQRLFPLIEEVNADQVAVEIVSKKGTAYLVSADEYHSLKETVYLLQSPRNAERLRESIAQLHAGTVEEHDLLE